MCLPAIFNRHDGKTKHFFYSFQLIIKTKAHYYGVGKYKVRLKAYYYNCFDYMCKAIPTETNMDS